MGSTIDYICQSLVLTLKALKLIANFKIFKNGRI